MEDARARELIHTARRGDLSGFRELVETFSRPLIAMAYRYTWDWETARDLCQDTWVRVYQKLDRFDPAGSFHGWLYTIHRNLCLSHLRRPAVRREESLEGDGEIPRDWVDRNPGPDVAFARRNFEARVRDALPELTERQREVFALVDLEQMEQREAAGLLGMKDATLRTTLHAARHKLADLLRPSEVKP